MEDPRRPTSDPHEAHIRIKDWVRRAGGMRVRERIEFSTMDDELHLAPGMTSKHVVDAIGEAWEVDERNDESFSLKPKPHALSHLSRPM